MGLKMKETGFQRTSFLPVLSGELKFRKNTVLDEDFLTIVEAIKVHLIMPHFNIAEIVQCSRN